MLRPLLLLLPVILIICVAANGPDRHGIATNYDASHGNTNTGGASTDRRAVTAVKKKTVRSKFHARAHHAKHHKRNHSFHRVKRAVTCDEAYGYRSADGTCNNLDNVNWGSAGQTYQRLLDPVYDDNTTNPRLKRTNGEYLPSPRDISVNVHDFDKNRYLQKGSVMLMEWGQFLAHDLSGTPVDDGDLTGDCCYDDLVTGTSLHPDVESGGPCHPIIISEDDRYFTNVSTRCMEFVRSYPVVDDDGVRQQMNELSAYIDGTNIYGVDEDEMDALRSFSDGKLKVENDDDLPESSDNYCIITDSTSNDYCLQAGDSRVNVYPGLGALHTIFMRYHNYVAEQLAEEHSDYNDETLFQETRKIVISVLQRITFNEYLPMIMGDDAVSDNGLEDTWSYNDSCDATLYNVFATAAFRFGHSMVPDALLINGTNVSSVDLYNKPYYVLNHLDSLVEGLVNQYAEKVDRWYSEGITDQLFETTAQNGYDVASLNIQRGRDHGLPAYNEWREHCGLDRYDSIDDMENSAAFNKAYDDADDVDLYSGALAEVNVGIVGATYACLLGKQFANLRNCDRFWWENEDATVGLASNRARIQIKRIRLSHVICLTTGITSIQQAVFRVPESDNNIAQSCDTLLDSSADYSRF